MSITIGPLDPIKVIFNILNTLMARKLISLDEARAILKSSLESSMSEIEKEKYLDSLFTKGNSTQNAKEQ